MDIIYVNPQMVAVLSVAFFVCLFGVVSNCLLLYVTVKSKQFFLQQLLGISDLCFCFFFLAAPPRIYWLYHGMYKDRVSAIVCQIYPWIYALNIGFTWPSIVTMAIALERFCASCFPIWYKTKWKTTAQRPFLRTIYLSIFFSILPAQIMMFIRFLMGKTVERQGSFTQCMSMFGKQYKTFCSVLGMFSGGMCALLSAGALIMGKQTRIRLGLTNDANFMKIQRRMERTVGAIVVASLILVFIPSSIRLLETLKMIPDWLVASLIVMRRYFMTMIIFNSGINFWLHLIFNSEFKKQAKIHILGAQPMLTDRSGKATRMSRAARVVSRSVKVEPFRELSPVGKKKEDQNEKREEETKN